LDIPTLASETASDRGTGGDGFEAAGVAASTHGAVVVREPNVADISGCTIHSMVELAVGHDPAADACPDLDE
jgi:hypothetical protein